ncbi:hypothetical protein B0H14DRAFT_1611043 [Mycena olivaceomarginata]|nr:hypothetical protein B0H14DRAFT_1611043 [Mycena olivaceomarginata]
MIDAPHVARCLPPRNSIGPAARLTTAQAVGRGDARAGSSSSATAAVGLRCRRRTGAPFSLALPACLAPSPLLSRRRWSRVRKQERERRAGYVCPVSHDLNAHSHRLLFSTPTPSDRGQHSSSARELPPASHAYPICRPEGCTPGCRQARKGGRRFACAMAEGGCARPHHPSEEGGRRRIVHEMDLS